MKGSIRFVVGLILIIGAVGGMDSATDAELLPLIGIAIVGLIVMAWGNSALEKTVY